MEAIAALACLSLSPRRYRSSNKFYEDETSAPSTPYYMSAPTSPRRPSAKEFEETPLGEVHCAVPFDWELTPGTPKRNRGSRKGGDIIDSSCEAEEGIGSRSSSPSPERLSHQSSTSDFDFSSARFITVEDTHALSNDVPIASADELFFHGQLLPLRLPPRLQAVKQLRESAADGSPFSAEEEFQGSFGRPLSPPRSMKFLSFRGRSKSPQRGDGEPVQEVGPKQKLGGGQKLQKYRSLSPLRIFKRDHSEVCALFSEKSTSSSDSASSIASSSSASSAFSSSSSSGDENFRNVGISKEFWPSFEEKQQNDSRTLNDILYSDKPPVSPKIDVTKLSSKEVLSKAERFKADQSFSEAGLRAVPQIVQSKSELAKTDSLERKRSLTPQLSRSNARSFSRTPIIPTQAQLVPTISYRTTHSRRSFGILKRCLGIAPASPRSP